MKFAFPVSWHTSPMGGILRGGGFYASNAAGILFAATAFILYLAASRQAAKSQAS